MGAEFRDIFELSCEKGFREIRREARKLDTQAMYEDWREAYRDLKKQRPRMSDVWHSRQIAKLDIANGRDPETIRKHMKR